MQSGYGEMQQFMVDGSLFGAPSNAPHPPPPPPHPAELHHHQLSHPHPHQPPHFGHFGHPAMPITQQLFQQQHHPHHQFQLFQHHHNHHQEPQQQQHMRLQDHQGLEHENPRGPASFLAAMNFKLGVSESSGGGGSRDNDNGLNDDDGILHGDDDGSDESRLHHHPWHRDGDQSTAPNIKQPFWRPLDIDFINPNNKRPSKDKQPELDVTSNIKHFKKSNEVLDHHGNYKLFSELEAIYRPGSTPIAAVGGPGARGGTAANCNNQTGSGSALTGDDDNPPMPATTPVGPTVDNISDTSNGGDVPPPPVLNKFQKGSSSCSGERRKRAKRRQQRQLASITTFFESLVKQLMDHQETLQRKFLEAMEKRDQERTGREEVWRKQESAKASREAAARAQERALAASRESAIISFLEKITGESLNLPTKSSQQINEEHDDANLQGNDQTPEGEKLHINAPDNIDNASNNYSITTGSGDQQIGSSRWPKAEVQALIRVRSGFETRFQEPGLKGPLWEDVSHAMSSLGYQRSAKRCKEKWENINKYFRKTKDSGRKRPQHSKTCPYFQLLDQLYSKSNNAHNAAANVEEATERKENASSELLDAIVVVSNEAGRGQRNNGLNDAINEDEDGDGAGDGDQEGQGESQDLLLQGQDDHQGINCSISKDNISPVQHESAHFLMT